MGLCEAAFAHSQHHRAHQFGSARHVIWRPCQASTQILKIKGQSILPCALKDGPCSKVTIDHLWQRLLSSLPGLFPSRPMEPYLLKSIAIVNRSMPIVPVISPASVVRVYMARARHDQLRPRRPPCVQPSTMTTSKKTFHCMGAQSWWRHILMLQNCSCLWSSRASKDLLYRQYPPHTVVVHGPTSHHGKRSSGAQSKRKREKAREPSLEGASGANGSKQLLAANTRQP